MAVPRLDWSRRSAEEGAPKVKVYLHLGQARDNASIRG